MAITEASKANPDGSDEEAIEADLNQNSNSELPPNTSQIDSGLPLTVNVQPQTTNQKPNAFVED